jgi:rhamnogalacturonan endolyase
MHDPQYRMSVAWQNVACNQPSQPAFHLGVGMQKPPRPRITIAARIKSAP